MFKYDLDDIRIRGAGNSLGCRDFLEKLITVIHPIKNFSAFIEFKIRQCGKNKIQALNCKQKQLNPLHILTDSSNIYFIGLNGKFLRFRRDGPFLKRLVTSDEKWIFCDNIIRKRQWCRSGEAPKPTPKKNLHSK
jgi:hypothetical protein